MDDVSRPNDEVARLFLFLTLFLCDGRYGEEVGTPRTSTKPKLVDALEGLTVMQVAMGYGHSLLLAK